MAKKKKTKKQSIGFKFIVMMFFLAVSSILFLPTTFLMAIGMLPTVVALIIDQDPGKNKSFTIGTMNFAGCFPFLLGIWRAPDKMETAMQYLADPTTIIIMYCAALMGYFINWFVTIAISSILVQRSKARIKKIEEQKIALEERWGIAVNGNYTLDEYGFPVQKAEPEQNSEKAAV